MQRKTMRTINGIALALCLAPWVAQAEPGWKGEAEVGFVSTGGNSETTTLNLKAKVTQEINGWQNKAKAEVLNASNQGATSAERYAAQFQTRRELSDKSYVYALIDGVHDRFSGIPYLLSESVGYGRKLYGGERFDLGGEIGLGARQSKERGQDVANDAVLRLGANATYALSDTAKLTEELSVEAGQDNTISKSVTALSAQVMNDLAMKLSFTIQNIATVPAGSKNTDYETAVTLVYSF